MSTQQTAIPLLIGPTASGKSRLAIEWAEANDAAIVCLDSRTIYRGLDIGTAKATRAEQQRVPHALLDIAEVGSPVSAADLADRAESYIASLQAVGRRCVVVGGSTLHLSALVKGLSPIPPPNSEVRAHLNQRLSLYGFDGLVANLKNYDAITASKMDLNNPARVIRALEVLESTGRPLSYWHSLPPTPPRFEYALVRLNSSADWLSQRITRRAQQMIGAGLLAETARHAHHADALRTVIGYREALDVMTGALPASALPERVAISTRQYARRQRRYFGKTFSDAIALDATSSPDVGDLSASFDLARQEAERRRALRSR